METASNYRRRGLLSAWLWLPFNLLSIRGESLADAIEEMRYLESHRRSYRKSRPMQIIMAALRRRIARG